MSPTRSERAVRIPSDRVLDELPARALTFLRTVGTHAGIRAALSDGGFTEGDHAEGWAFLGAACAWSSQRVDLQTDASAREAFAGAAHWVASYFPRLEAALARLHPDRADLVPTIDSPTALSAALALAILLQRIEDLERAGAADVIATLAQRGLNVQERARLAALVATAQAAPMTVKAGDTDGPMRETRAAELVALHYWFSDWSATAHAVIARRDWLVSLGLVRRKQRASGDSELPDTVSHSAERN